MHAEGLQFRREGRGLPAGKSYFSLLMAHIVKQSLKELSLRHWAGVVTCIYTCES